MPHKTTDVAYVRRAALLAPVTAALALAACATSPRAAPPAASPPAPQRAPAITTAAQLVSAIHDRYAAVWFHTVTFHQTTTIATPSGGDIVQSWHEAARLPGILRIDTDSNGSGVLYAGDSIFSFANGRLTRADTGRNDLLLLGFDLYVQPAETSLALLRARGFDLERMHTDTWNGRPVYVVGAFAGDTASKQFWVNQDDLLFVRLLQHRLTRAGAVQSDIRFEKYVRAGGGWIAAEVQQLANGKRRVTEAYDDIRADVPLADAVFDPRQWGATTNWMK